MPALVSVISINFDELLEYGTRAANTFGGEASGVVVMAIYITIMLVVRVLRPKECRAERAGEVLHVKLLVTRGNIAATERHVAFRTY
jgi:hypothetical protein